MRRSKRLAFLTVLRRLLKTERGKPTKTKGRGKKATLEALKAALAEHKAALEALNSKGEARHESHEAGRHLSATAAPSPPGTSTNSGRSHRVVRGGSEGA